MDNAVAEAPLWSGSIPSRGETRSQQARLAPLSNFVSLRFDRDTNIVNILKEVINTAYFRLPGGRNPAIELETTPGQDLRVFRKPRKRGDQPLAVFPMCWYDLHMKDPFFGLAVKKVAGLPRYPLTMNITLLRNLLTYLNNKKIRYEIW